ncbi:MAG: NAD-binding protein, partial [Gammaproteobacteria bacterium]|nr:NAD-binding protein [Gammaproteobacteria bacterium]
VGQVVADMLKHDGENVLIIDNTISRVEMAKQKGFLAIAGDAGGTNLLQTIEERRKASMVLCLTTDDVTNVYITLTAKSMHKDIKIISRANRDETIRKLELAGADHVITPYEVVGLVASESIGQAVAFEAIYGTLTGHKYYSIDTVIFPTIAQSDIFRVQDIDFSQFKLLLLGIIVMDETEVSAGNGSYPLKKHQFVFNPKDVFRVSSGMMLVVFGHQYSIEHFRDRLAASKFHGGKLVI